MHVSHAVHIVGSVSGWNPELKKRPGFGLLSACFTTMQCHRSQLQMKPISDAILSLM
jgi:hypothetical protein